MEIRDLENYYGSLKVEANGVSILTPLGKESKKMVIYSRQDFKEYKLFEIMPNLSRILSIVLSSNNQKVSLFDSFDCLPFVDVTKGPTHEGISSVDIFLNEDTNDVVIFLANCIVK